nr:telomere-associated protein RIF1 [Helicoverpa armigera]
MPEENMNTAIVSALEGLEHYSLENHLSRSKNYGLIQSALDAGDELGLEETERLLAVCVHDLKEDMRHITTIMNIVSVILSRVMVGKYVQRPDLLPSALAVISVINTTALMSKVEAVKLLCFETYLSYPTDTLIAAAEHHEEHMEIFNLYCHMRIPPTLRLQACLILHKYMKILPPEKKRQFIDKGVSVWFSKVIPTIMTHLTTVPTDHELLVETLEHLTEELITVDYTGNPQWKSVLECICNGQKYPSVMKGLLQKGSILWHRLWIVFIRLLKHQVTEPQGSVGTPINSMLPVVEAAFKVDVANRCKAFECWNVLIDSFSTETNESNINKRIKLLIIPLKSNNAKAEVTALAKFKCWWHLIQKFQSKVDKFIDTILVSFLHFCFGKHNAIDKSVLIPGQMTVTLKKQCIQAMVDMVGHVSCNGCTNLPKLKGKLINTKNLVDNWNHWIFSLTSTIMMSNTDHGLNKQQMTCLWKSYLFTIGELPENNIRKDLFNEMLSILEHLVKQSEHNSKLAVLVFDVLLLSLFDEDMRMKQLLMIRNDSNESLCKVITCILDPRSHVARQSCDFKEMVTTLRPVVKVILDSGFGSPTFAIHFLLKNLTTSNISCIVWTALAESVSELPHSMLSAKSLSNMLLWPLPLINSFTQLKPLAMTWYTMYDAVYSKVKQNEVLEEAISKLIFADTEDNKPAIYFKLCVTIAVIKQQLAVGKVSEKELEVLYALTSRIDNYQNYEALFFMLIDRIFSTIKSIKSSLNETAARFILLIMMKTLKVMTHACKKMKTTASLILPLVESLLKFLIDLLQVENDSIVYDGIIPVIADDLCDSCSYLSNQPLTKASSLIVMKTIVSKIDETHISYKKIKLLVAAIENETACLDKNKFTTPKTKEVPKKAKKIEPSIVNKVVDNGEIYEVVKSNWKFNPRKLTENQKEKLQRKRDDIPALYQDLSQSQDEFKLVSWKTDSQDTSNSSKSESKSNTGDNETTTDILTKLPSSNDVCSNKILENFFSENIKRDDAKVTVSSDKIVNKVEPPVTPKTTKSPRMALKDRVFRNVRNLIEKSGDQKGNKDSPKVLNKTECIAKSPTQSKRDETASVVNSAPPMLSADRPSRVKRKPKKFEELLLLNSKKSRQSLPVLKSKDQAVQSNSTTSTTDKSDRTENNDKELSPPESEKDGKKPDDLQVPEIQTISEVDGIVQIDVNPQKEVSKVSDETVRKTTDVEEAGKETVKKSTDVEESGKETVKKSTDVEESGKETVKKATEIEEAGKATVRKATDVKEAGKETVKKATDVEETGKESVKKATDVKEARKETVKKATDVEETGKDTTTLTVDDSMDIAANDQTPTSKATNVERVVVENKVSSVSKTNTCDDNKDKKPAKRGRKPRVVQEQICIVENSENSQNIDEQSEQIDDELVNENNDENTSRKTSPSTKDAKQLSTPLKITKTTENEEQKLTTKKKSIRKSRIEKELAIDMVEGHPFLKMQSQTRLTRKALESTGGRRKSLFEKLNKSKSEVSSGKSDKKSKEKTKDSDSSANSSVTVEDSEDKDVEMKDQTSFSDELPDSEDVIESSQDSTITTISVKSTKKSSKKIPVVTLEKMNLFQDVQKYTVESQSILDCAVIGVQESTKGNQGNKDDSKDIEFSLNKTVAEDKIEANLTENMDTEPIDDKVLSVIIINDDIPTPVTISSDETEVGPETQELAEADTQPTDPTSLMEVDNVQKDTSNVTVINITNDDCNNTEKEGSLTKDRIDENVVNPSDNRTLTLSESVCAELEKESGSSSPSAIGDEAKRKQDFLNNTLEISPIKNMSPERSTKSPSPETSSDFVVITLSSPVHSNGEPYEKGGSPEVFTEDKVSPDKRDLSPPRVEVTVTNTSPSSSLSLKKNRPQVRSVGRAAQMLGLCCVPDKVQAIINQEKLETEEIKKTSTTSTPARRNLRILYNSVSENIEPPTENEDSEHFLKFRRSLPAVDSSPAGPILKRKLVEIADDATISPASKRKRVSFHDPPVSTTVSVHKYIEPGGVRSPQNSAHKRLERQLRQHTPIKSPKRLDHVFKLDTVLNKAIESFSETGPVSTPDDTQAFSLDETPVVEIIRASELNDSDPICPDLVDCKDPIDNIASELSSSAMKSLLVKELVGKVETVGDLAKMTELEVNRLCIKAPKVKVAKKVLSDYASKRVEKPSCDIMVTIDEAIFDEPMPEPQPKGVECVDSEMQTVTNASVEMEMQTMATPTAVTFVQTETTSTVDTVAQTDESGSKSTADIVKLILAERPDFVDQVGIQLEESSIRQISERLPISAITDVLMKKVTPSDAKTLLNRVLEKQWNKDQGNDNRSSKELSFIREYMCDRFDPKDLILFCSEVLKSVYDTRSPR